VIYFDSQQQIHEKDEIEELTGKLTFQQLEDKFMHSVLENDKKIIDSGSSVADIISSRIFLLV